MKDSLDRLSYIPLNNALLYRVSGTHACRYLHGRLTQNISQMSIGEGRTCALTDAAGKVQSVFRILRESEHSFLILCDGGESDLFTSSLLQFRVAEDVTIRELSDYQLVHIAPDPLAPKIRNLSQPQSQADIPWHMDEELIAMRFQRLQAPGIDVAGPTIQMDAYISQLKEAEASCLTEEQYTLARVLANRPTFPFDIQLGSLLSEVDLDSYASFSKGCYVGQEVLEKISARGKAPQKLFPVILSERAELHGNDTVGLVHPEDGESALLGKLISSGYDPETEKTYGFARLKNRESLPGKEILVNGVLGSILS